MYTGNDRRAELVLRSLLSKVADVNRMRALGYCVSVEHAKFMAERFTEAGVPAECVHAAAPSDLRAEALKALRDGTVKALLAVDLFNEGLDVPGIDTVLFLRPTESATVFLQQLGRGLRRAPGKSCLTVLDFIGRQHTRFRFDLRLRALTRAAFPTTVRAGFPFLPAGCHMNLDPVATDIVLRLAADDTRHVTLLLPGTFEPCPLALHARYSREELLAGLGATSLDRPPSRDREGVRWVAPHTADVFTFALHKSERDYSPTTMYRDYAISPSLVHWESQSTTSEDEAH